MTSTSSPIKTFSKHRTVVDDLVRDELRLLQIRVAIGLAQFPFGQMIGKAERHVAARAGKHVQKHAKTLRAARDVVEHDARAVFGAQHRLGGEPDIFLPAGAANIANFAEPFGERRAIRANRHRRSWKPRRCRRCNSSGCRLEELGRTERPGEGPILRCSIDQRLNLGDFHAAAL